MSGKVLGTCSGHDHRYKPASLVCCGCSSGGLTKPLKPGVSSLCSFCSQQSPFVILTHNKAVKVGAVRLLYLIDLCVQYA